MKQEKQQIVQETISHLLNDEPDKASSLISESYPHQWIEKNERKFSDKQRLELFMRDGFIDRYSGKKLVLPGMLMALHLLMPDEIPSHPNWKMSESHIMFWHLFPTYDHVIPIARGGEDTLSNCVTTSMTLNSSKAGFLMEEVGFKLFLEGNMDNYDGLISDFINCYKKFRVVRDSRYCTKWYKLVQKL